MVWGYGDSIKAQEIVLGIQYTSEFPDDPTRVDRRDSPLEGEPFFEVTIDLGRDGVEMRVIDNK